MPAESEIEIIIATADDAELISSILREAAEWLISKGEKLWECDELDVDAVAGEVADGMYRIALSSKVPAGCYRFQTEDLEYWNDVPHEDSAFIHRVAVRREFGRLGISSAMMANAKNEAREIGRKYLRLDCADRPKLRSVYERQGFVFHSFKEREPYRVARYEFKL